MGQMKNFAAIAILAGLVAQPVFAGETLDRVLRKKVLIEVTDQAYPPFSQVNDKGEVVGFDIDVAREIGKRLGVEIKVETPTFEIITSGRWKGRYDLCVCSMSQTTERMEVLDFITAYYEAPAVIVTSGDNVDIKSPADLTGKRVGAEASTTYEKYLNKNLNIPGSKPPVYGFDNLQTKPYESEVMAFQDLGLGNGKRLDAIVANYLTAKSQVDKSDGKFKIVGEPVFEEALWIAADKDDAEWSGKIKSIVADMIKDGTLAKISEKWLGADLTPKS